MLVYNFERLVSATKCGGWSQKITGYRRPEFEMLSKDMWCRQRENFGIMRSEILENILALHS